MTGEGWESQLITGLAEHLAGAGIGMWRPAGVYTAGEIGIVNRAVPQTPDQIITLADYVVGSGGPSATADMLIGVQIRIRGTTDPRACSDLGAAIFDLLDSSGRQTWSTVSIVDAWRQSYTSLGFDGNNRWEASHNYYVAAMRPTLHRTD